MISHIYSVIIQYLSPLQLLAFGDGNNNNDNNITNYSFKYDAHEYSLTPSILNYICSFFPNMILSGINISTTNNYFRSNYKREKQKSKCHPSEINKSIHFMTNFSFSYFTDIDAFMDASPNLRSVVAHDYNFIHECNKKKYNNVQSLNVISSCAFIRAQKKFPKLKHICVDEWSLPEIQTITSNSTLKTITLHYILFNIDLSPLQHCKHLRKLVLGNCDKLFSLDPLKLCPSLRILKIKNSWKYTSLSSLASCTFLRKIVLYKSNYINIKDIPATCRVVII